MRVSVHFYSYFRDLTGCEATVSELPEGSTVDDLVEAVLARFPKMAGMQKAMLIAVGVEYQSRNHVLQAGDEVSFFPPVQGG
jgi:molybdopterin converting factor small subunit